jgi:hypothetical protein
MGATTSLPQPSVPGSKGATELAERKPISKAYDMKKKVLGEGSFSTVL